MRIYQWSISDFVDKALLDQSLRKHYAQVAI